MTEEPMEWTHSRTSRAHCIANVTVGTCLTAILGMVAFYLSWGAP